MHYNPIIYRKVIIAILGIGLFLTACKKDEPPVVEYDYLIEYELVKSYTPQEVELTMLFGKLLYPEIESLIPGAVDGVRLYKLKYFTMLDGEKITASGLVSIPMSSGDYPILSFQNGTNTCHSNAPSVNSSNELYSLIGIMASHGYIVSIPDYIGFGESDNYLHPYHHAASSNSSIIDLLRATNEFTGQSSGTEFNNEVYLLGYSQGGWATLNAARKLEELSDNEFVPMAAACGAGAYDLMEMSKWILDQVIYTNPFYLPYFIESHIQNGFMTEDLGTYFKEPYATDIPSLFDGSRCNTEMNEEFTDSIHLLLQQDLIANFESGTAYASLRDELTTNSVVAWNTDLPLRFYHSEGDSSVPSFLSERIYNDFIAKGVNQNLLELEIIENDTVDHNDAIVPWGVDALLWINELK